MIIYWILLAIPAVMALAYPVHHAYQFPSLAQRIALAGFFAVFVFVATVREEIGADWIPYAEMYETARFGGYTELLFYSEPAYALVVWISTVLGTGVYFPNGVAALLLSIGIYLIAIKTRDPWLTVVIAVPYVMIVVGMGYVRQAAAMGLIMIAIDALDKRRLLKMSLCLALAISFQATSAVTLPLFGYALANRNKFVILLTSAASAALLYIVLAPRLESYSEIYLESEYESGGTLPRLLAIVLPSILILVRRNFLPFSTRLVDIWILMALVNIVLLIALYFSPSSTAIDRLSLYFQIIQLVAFGSIVPLLLLKGRTVFVFRLILVGIAALIQTVWLVLASHAQFWVPYQSLLQYI